jgi:hypothetical protein
MPETMTTNGTDTKRFSTSTPGTTDGDDEHVLCFWMNRSDKSLRFPLSSLFPPSVFMKNFKMPPILLPHVLGMTFKVENQNDIVFTMSCKRLPEQVLTHPDGS